jgi:hypothetical protein
VESGQKSVEGRQKALKASQKAWKAGKKALKAGKKAWKAAMFTDLYEAVQARLIMSSRAERLRKRGGEKSAGRIKSMKARLGSSRTKGREDIQDMDNEDRMPFHTQGPLF